MNDVSLAEALDALRLLDKLFCGFAEVVRTEDWGDDWYIEAIPEVRAAFTAAADVLAKADPAPVVAEGEAKDG